MILKKYIFVAAVLLLAVACTAKQELREPQVVPQPASLQRTEGSFRIDRNVPVYVDIADSAILRTPCAELTKAELKSRDLKVLMAKMLKTLRSPQQDGVGIAAPQVGISKRIIWLQRFDKDGGPFECYLNPHIDSLFGDIGKGPEGCLSIPPMRGLVPRYTSVLVSYVHPETLEHRQDTVHGYTAVIFQHECDHLDGILYIDRADTVYVSSSWEAERKMYDYSRPEWWPLPSE